jgi:hypothetical protein
MTRYIVRGSPSRHRPAVHCRGNARDPQWRALRLRRRSAAGLGTDDYTPSTITRVYAADGQVIGEFATQRRVIISYDDINPLLRQAIIATEDAEFDRHFGVNIWRIFVAAVTDIMERRRVKGPARSPSNWPETCAITLA